ncbi:MAG: patatin-like phospholipase family protein [Phycisphaerae bacterium]|nr:patatin-like phospholipase family protein [Saprospiraceae bacterium]
MHNITKLVFEGGGVKGIAYAGVLQVFEQKGVLQNVDGVAGTSAGAITACLLSLRYSAADIKTLIGQVDFGSFADHENLLHKYHYYGMHPGDTFLDWLKQCIKNKGLSEDATFQDFHNAHCLDLKVYSCDINARQLQEFSLQETPTVIVAEAVRASMSIPLYFNAWQFPSGNPNNHLFVDGGMVYNYPIFAFSDGEVIDWSVLGFRLEDVHSVRHPVKFGYGEWMEYVKNTFETLMEAQSFIYERDPEQVERTVVIDDLGVSSTDFDITEAQKQALFDSGVAAATGYFAAAK